VIVSLVTAMVAAGLEPDWRDVADTLWLAHIREPVTKRGAGAGVVGGHSHPLPASPRPDRGRYRPELSPRARPHNQLPPRPADSVADRATGIPLDVRPPRLPQASPSLAVEQALNPFRNSQRPSSRMRIDIEATIRHYCDTKLLAPIQVAEREGWFDEAVVVVDANPTMVVWHDLANRVAKMLARSRAIHAVVRWLLEFDGTIPKLVSRDGMIISGAEVSSPNRRQLIIVMTDCVGTHWRRPEIWESLRECRAPA